MQNILAFAALAVALVVAPHFCGAATAGSATDSALVPPPQETARRLCELFLSTDPTLYKPLGYSGGKAYGGGKLIHYATVSLWVNAMECAAKMHDEALLARLVAAFEPYYGERASVMNDYRHVDLAVVGAVPLEIAVLKGDERAKALGLRYADRQWEEPREGLDWGDRWYDKIPLAERRDWWQKGFSPQTRLWIDDMYMITLLETQAWRATGEHKYIVRAAREMCLYLERLQRPDGLFNHAPGAPFAWGRGNGWMAAGMALNLRYLDGADPARAKILAGFRKMARSLLAWQRPSGLWGQIVDDAESWDETSASAMFAYALQEGLAFGAFKPQAGVDGTEGEGAEEDFNEEKIRSAVMAAYAALVTKLDEHGNLADVCAGTGWKNDRRHYMGRPRINGDPHGQAPLLWLCSALMSR